MLNMSPFCYNFIFCSIKVNYKCNGLIHNIFWFLVNLEFIILTGPDFCQIKKWKLLREYKYPMHDCTKIYHCIDWLNLKNNILNQGSWHNSVFIELIQQIFKYSLSSLSLYEKDTHPTITSRKVIPKKRIILFIEHYKIL